MSHESVSIEPRRNSAMGDENNKKLLSRAMRGAKATNKARRKGKDLSFLEDEVLRWRRTAAEKDVFTQLIHSLSTITGSEKANKDDVLPLLRTFYAFKNSNQIFLDLDTYCKDVSAFYQQLQNLSAKMERTFPPPPPYSPRFNLTHFLLLLHP